MRLRLMNLLMAGLLSAVAVFVCSYWAGPAIAGEGSWALAGLSVVVAGVLVMVAAACLVIAWLGAERSRLLQSGVAIALLFTFPIGTFYAVYALFVCWRAPRRATATWP